MFKQYRKKAISELRPYQEGEALNDVTIAEVDKVTGSPKAGDMIARNPTCHDDKWLVSKKYFEENFEPVE